MIPKSMIVSKKQEIREQLEELAAREVLRDERLVQRVIQNPCLLHRAGKIMSHCGSLEQAVERVLRYDEVMQKARAQGINVKGYNVVFDGNIPYLVPKEFGFPKREVLEHLAYQEVSEVRVVEAEKNVLDDFLIYAVGPRKAKQTEGGIKQRYTCITIKSFDGSLPASAAFNLRAKASNAVEEVAYKLWNAFRAEIGKTVISIKWQHFGLVGIILNSKEDGTEISNFIERHYVAKPNNGKRVNIDPDCIPLENSMYSYKAKGAGLFDTAPTNGLFDAELEATFNEWLMEVPFCDLSGAERKKIHENLYGSHRRDKPEEASHYAEHMLTRLEA
jgi:hypothetical protein